MDRAAPVVDAHLVHARNRRSSILCETLALVAAAALIQATSACGSGAKTRTAAPVASSAVYGRASSTPAPPAGSNEGGIQCGAELCKAGAQRCCPFPEMHCIPQEEQCLGSAVENCQGDWRCEHHFGLTCDSLDDCPGARCCQMTYTGTSVSCETQCGDFEVCASGGTCSEGLVCTPSTWSMTGFLCLPEVQGATCGPKRCPAERPCLHDQGNDKRCVAGSNECAAEGAPQAGYACTTSADCGGYVCCLGVMGSACSASCRIDQQGAVCTSVGDCPKVPSHVAVRCEPPPSVPLSRCEYEREKEE